MSNGVLTPLKFPSSKTEATSGQLTITVINLLQQNSTNCRIATINVPRPSWKRPSWGLWRSYKNWRPYSAE